MRKGFYFILSFVFLFSCKKDDSPQYDWMRIELTGADGVYDIYGNIDNELLVATRQGILKTTDRGKNWREVLDFRGEFRLQGDSLLAIGHQGTEHWFSLDNGEHWTMFYEDDYASTEDYQWVTTSTDIDYRVESPFNEPLDPDRVLKSTESGGDWIDVFPYKHIITAIYMDSTDRLYLGTNGFDWNSSTATMDTTQSSSAMLYILEP